MYRLIAGTALFARGLRSRTRMAQIIVSGTGAMAMIDGVIKTRGHIRQHFARRP
jgi:hypothetical protein